MAKRNAFEPQAVGGTISNLINGVSQQPSNIRFANQADECVNQMPTLQEQLARRNPIELLFNLVDLVIDEDSSVHCYRRDDTEAYAIVLNGDAIQVYSLEDGSEKTVTMSQPMGDTYHESADALGNFYCYTYKDVTFIVNRAITCAMTASLATSRTPEGLIKVKDVADGYTYDITIKVGSGGAQSITTVTASSDTVNSIATDIKNAIDTLAISGVTTAVYGNVVHVKHNTNTILLEAKDNRAGSALMAFTSQVQRVSDLPLYAPDGYKVKVVGASSIQNSQDQNTADDVWYEFNVDGASAFASGVWVESLQGGIKYEFDAKTMPHILTRESNGTFTYEQIDWVDRMVGDEVTNPTPLFIGETIHSCYLASNRFGLNFSGYSMLSRVDEPNYFNFWKTTVLTSLDTDPVIMPVPSPQVNKVFWATQWNGELMLFGDNLDAAVSWQSALAPNKILIDTPTSYGISPKVAPFISGTTLFFPKNRGEYSVLYEYQLDPVTSLKKAENRTEYVGSYIPKDVIQLDGLEQDFIMMLTDSVRDKLYCYNYARKNNQLVQQAFHRWEFNEDITIYGIFVDTDRAYIIYGLGDLVFAGQILLSVGAKDDGYPGKCYLDHRITESFDGLTIAYNAGTDRTTITLPFSFGEATKTVELRALFNNYPVGHIPTIESQDDEEIVIVGDWEEADFFIGFTYNSYYDPCKFHVYQPNPEGGAPLVDMWKKVEVKKLVLAYSNTGFWQLLLLNRATGAQVHLEEMPIKMDNIETVFDEYTLYGDFHVTAIIKSMDTHKIRIQNNSTRPSYFTGISWYGEGFDGKA